jgi:hypothetical protein
MIKEKEYNGPKLSGSGLGQVAGCCESGNKTRDLYNVRNFLTI